MSTLPVWGANRARTSEWRRKDKTMGHTQIDEVHAGRRLDELVAFALSGGCAFRGRRVEAMDGRALWVEDGHPEPGDELLMQAIDRVARSRAAVNEADALGWANLHDESPVHATITRSASGAGVRSARIGLAIVHERRRAERQRQRGRARDARQLPRRPQRARTSHGARSVSRSTRGSARSGDDDCGPGEPDSAGRAHARLIRRGTGGRWVS